MKINLVHLAQHPAPIRLGCFILALLLLWLPFATPIYLLVHDANLVSILTIVLLYVEFIFLLKLWGKYVYQEPHILRHYGLEISRQNGVYLLRGLATGIITVLVLFGLQGAFGWLVWQQPHVFLVKIVLEGFIVGLGVGFAEELLFRGWLLNELHFIKPLEAIIHTLPQFPALVLLGLTQVWGKRWHRGRLSLPIGLHGGLVWGYYIINIGGLIKYSGQVPDWVTGVNNNPLQGVMGVLFMSILALWMRGRTVKK
jgi:uncharacterized protein